MAFAFAAILISFYIAGGAMSLIRLSSPKTFMKGPDELLAKIVKLKTPKMEPIFCSPMKLNPISMLTGHPVFIGNSQMLWNRGAIFEDILLESSRVIWEKNGSNIMDKYHYKYAVEWRENQFLMSNNHLLDDFSYINYTNDWILMERIHHK